jgi:hypothetical protein
VSTGISTSVSGVGLTNATLNAGGGNISLRGQGYAGTTFSNYGVNLDVGTISTTGAGNITVVGTGGAATRFGNFGVRVAGSITGGSTGTTTVTGTGGAATSNINYGVYITDAGTAITSTGGAVQVTGTGGAGGTGSNTGVVIELGATVSSGGNGNVSVTGNGGGAGGTGGSNNGVNVASAGSITAGGSGTVTVQGTGGASTSDGNIGVSVSGANSKITSGGGAISVTGTGGGSGASAQNFGVQLATSAQISSAGNAPITVTTDSYTGDGTESVNAGTGTVTLRNRSAGTLIGLGSADVLSGSPLTLGLTDAELDRITAGTLVIGRTGANASGTVTVASAVSPAVATSVTVLTGGNIAINAGLGASNQLTLTAGNGAGVSGSGNLTAVGLLLNGSNVNYTLNSASGNAVGTLAATGAGSLRYANTGALTLGTVGATSGISASGLVTITTSGAGDITVADAVGAGAATTLNATAGSVNLDATVSLTGAAAPLLVQANGDILQAAGVAVQSNGGAITYNANGSGTGGVIEFAMGASISSQGGAIALGGGTAGDASGAATGHLGHLQGIAVQGATLSAGSGNIRLRGTGGGDAASAHGVGVLVNGGASISITSGSLTLTGTGAALNQGDNNHGVEISGTATVSSTGGSIDVTGQGGGGGNSSANVGVLVRGSGSVMGGPGIPVSVTGTGGGQAGGSGSDNVGVWVDAAGSIAAGGFAGLNLYAVGGYGNGGSHDGMRVSGGGSLNAAGSSLFVIGVASEGASYGISLIDGQVNAVGGGMVLQTDTFNAQGTSAIDAGNGLVTLYNLTLAVPIDLGGADVLSSSPTLGISADEIDRISAGSLFIGRNDSQASGTLTLSADVSPAHVPVLYLDSGADMLLDHALTVSDSLTLYGAGGSTVGGTGVLTVPHLFLFGASTNYNLSGANAVGEVVADSSNNVLLHNAGGLTVGNRFGTGISAYGSIDLSTQSGAITLNGSIYSGGDVRVQAGGALHIGAATTLYADDGNITLVAQRFVNDNPDPTTLALGTTGRAWQVWSSNANPFGGATPDVRGGLTSYDFKQYNAIYGVTTPLGAGNGYLYTLAPSISFTLGGSTGKVFDGDTTASTAGLTLSNSGTVDGDSFGNTFTSASYDTRNVGSLKTVTLGGLETTASNGAATVYGYAFGTASGPVGSITPKVLDLSGSKVYDRSTSVAAAALSLSGLVGTETLALSGSGSTADKNVGTAKAVSLGTLALGDGSNGGLAGNYTLSGGTDTVNISKASIAVSGIAAANKA